MPAIDRYLSLIAGTFADPEPLASALRKPDRAQAIFSGHTHWEGEADINGVPVHTTPATCCQYKHKPGDPTSWIVPPHPPGYRVIETDARGDLKSRVVWVPEAAAYIRAQAIC